MKYDKRNGDVVFIEGTHEYRNVKDPQLKYISVTTLIGKYEEEFDEDFWSSYKALEKLFGEEVFKASPLKQQLLKEKKFDPDFVHMMPIDYSEFMLVKNDILDEWDRNNKDACEYGGIYHKKMEDMLYGRPDSTIAELGLGSILELADRRYTVVQNDCDLTLPQSIKSEFLLYWSCEDNILNLAGQADIVIKDGNDIYILDHKTNAKGIQVNSFYDKKRKSSKRMKHPINHLDDCNLTHYTLQLSMYAWMIQRINPEFNIKLLRLLHIDREGNKSEFDLEYRKEEVELLLKAYKLRLIEEHVRTTGRMPKLKANRAGKL